MTMTWQWGERIRVGGVGGGFLERFLGRWWGGEWGVLFLGQSGGPPLWVSPLGVPFEGFEGFGVVPLRGLAFEHFVHGILSMGLGPDLRLLNMMYTYMVRSWRYIAYSC